jgi:hypothetical protein
MAFKYYLRGPDNWTELSGRMQHLLARFDDDALSLNMGPMTGIRFPIPVIRYGLGRPAKYEVRCTWENSVHFRTMDFENGEKAHVQFAETAPDVLDTDWYYPAPPAV